MTKPDSDGEGTQDSQSESSNSQSNQKGSSGEAQYVTVEQFQTLNQSIENLRRSFQSDKDKGIKRVEQKVDAVEGDLRTILQQASQSGKSVGDILSELEAQEEREARQAMLEMSRAFREGKLSGDSRGSGQQQGVNTSAVMAELELDESDTRVQAFRAKTFTSETEAYREGAKLLKQISTNQPSDADSPSKEGKRQSVPANEEQLQQEYQQRSKDLNGRALLNLKMEMRKKGLSIS